MKLAENSVAATQKCLHDFCGSTCTRSREQHSCQLPSAYRVANDTLEAERNACFLRVARNAAAPPVFRRLAQGDPTCRATSVQKASTTKARLAAGKVPSVSRKVETEPMLHSLARNKT